MQNHLAQILLVHMLRAHAGQTDRPTGWLGALNEDGIGAALRAVHESAFSTAFRRVVGTSPAQFRNQARQPPRPAANGNRRARQRS
ncbi:helix-turn-helix transcriptional regulator [Streptomyces sp. NPDC006645]|uniref:helix-turn-helix transcriptional regulator n=1 Tax=Streptomyces sp. NPDC006645 TaxID=3157184 RepID=UPI0033AA81FE